MKIKSLFFFALTLIAFSSCTVEEIDPDIASQITGSYTMNTYVTQSGTSAPGTGDKIVISREDDTHVTILVDYAGIASSDVELASVVVTESGDKYLLDRSFSNATADGEVDGNELMLNIEYTSGNFVNITASK